MDVFATSVVAPLPFAENSILFNTSISTDGEWVHLRTGDGAAFGFARIWHGEMSRFADKAMDDLVEVG